VSGILVENTATSVLRRLMDRGGQIATYARIALAVKAGRGCRLTDEECADMLANDAISQALWTAIEEAEDEEAAEINAAIAEREL
jgi:hypothetical protein